MTLSKKQREVIKAWREEICRAHGDLDPGEDLDWHALFIGFAIGRGLSIDEATDYDLYDQHALPLESL